MTHGAFTIDEKKMTVEKKTDNRVVALEIEGFVTLYDVKKLFEVLKESFETGDALKINLTKVAFIHVSGIQLLWSAHKTAKKIGKEFSIAGMSETVAEAVRRAGLNHSPLIDSQKGGRQCHMQS